ncbi:DUF6445 family protein [Sphingomicrobium sediminis]|uniref:DUF6445 family protein n=1 Tax=Sphingomicrobium sediminis TaxID=2950949 RepID=A0A9X2EJL0_9SPHN|nr:DUF6445 family protein [Sphingomicrobium sediminis]MCM8557986.1 DUF6445 family protein [Sphingomicrobium sediminis]
MNKPTPQVQVYRLGKDQEPLVIVDNFTGQAEALRKAGEGLDYQRVGPAYPGVRAPAPEGYLHAQRPILMKILQEIFGVRERVDLKGSMYSLVTDNPDDLGPLQRVPHYDSAQGEMMAAMHYLGGPEDGGTAFYRHNATGFEAITPEREPIYNEAMQREADKFGMPEARYFHGDNDRYTMIAQVQSVPDRFALYRGRLLHSGIIPDDAKLSDDPAKGRLTLNSFMTVA